MTQNKKYFKGFTLVEVLIVLTVVGFLFTLTIPNLMMKRNTLEYCNKAKDIQAELEAAFTKTSALNGNVDPLNWESVKTSPNKAEAITKELSKNLKILSYCGNSPKGCFSTNEYKTLSGAPTKEIFQQIQPSNENYTTHHEKEEYTQINMNELNSFYDNSSQILEENNTVEANPMVSQSYIALLNGGSALIKTNSTHCNATIPSIDRNQRPLCGEIIVDINGSAIPNRLGVDVFGFYISENTILPMGFYGDDFSFNSNCLFDNTTNQMNGLACTAWAIRNKNMDYRKCKAGIDIDWTKSTKCDR